MTGLVLEAGPSPLQGFASRFAGLSELLRPPAGDAVVVVKTRSRREIAISVPFQVEDWPARLKSATKPLAARCLARFAIATVPEVDATLAEPLLLLAAAPDDPKAREDALESAIRAACGRSATPDRIEALKAILESLRDLATTTTAAATTKAAPSSALPASGAAAFRDRVRLVFRLLAPPGRPELTFPQFKRAVASIFGSSLSDETLRQIFASEDVNASNTITLDEFQDAVKSVMRHVMTLARASVGLDRDALVLRALASCAAMCLVLVFLALGIQAFGEPEAFAASVNGGIAAGGAAFVRLLEKTAASPEAMVAGATATLARALREAMPDAKPSETEGASVLSAGSGVLTVSLPPFGGLLVDPPTAAPGPAVNRADLRGDALTFVVLPERSGSATWSLALASGATVATGAVELAAHKERRVVATVQVDDAEVALALLLTTDTGARSRAKVARH